MEIKKIGATMKLIRNSKNLSLEKEAEMLGITRNTLAIYENNPDNMSIGLFNKFLKIHNITRDIFFEQWYDKSHIDN